MMKKLVLVLLVAGLALPAAAQMGPRPAPERVPGPEATAGLPGVDAQGIPLREARQAVIRFLDLTEGQVADWDLLMATLRDTVQPLEDQLHGVEEQLRELLGGEAPDPAAVGALVIQGKGLREQIGAARLGYVQGFEQLLDETQQGKLAFLRRAARAQPLFPAFRVFGLLPPPGQAPPPPPTE